MTDATLELQGAITARLKSYAPLASFIGVRVYDEVPATAVKPYISFGPTDAIYADADCVEADEITTQIDVWSDKGGSVECRRIAALVRQALSADIELSDNGLVLLEHRITRVFRDADGKTFHGAITMRSVIEQS